MIERVRRREFRLRVRSELVEQDVPAVAKELGVVHVQAIEAIRYQRISDNVARCAASALRRNENARRAPGVVV